MTTLINLGMAWPTAQGLDDGRPSPVQVVLSVLTALSVIYIASIYGNYRSVPDWLGYEYLYITGGGWLAEGGRDPVFTFLLSVSYNAFGISGYETFRTWVTAYFIAMIFYFCWTAPLQYRLSGVGSALLVGLVASAMFSMKALVQIREGIAFSMLMFAVILTIRCRYKHLLLFVAGLCVLAVLTHSGLAIPAFALIGSWMIARFVNDNNQLNRQFHVLTLASSVVIGLCIAFVMTQFPDVTRDYFEGFVSERSDISSAGLVKYLYWLVMCVCCVVMNRQSLEVDTAGLSKVAIACVYSLGSIMLPVCFSLVFGLIVFGFSDGTVISSFGRILFTAMSLTALAIIILRGARAPLLLVSIFILADQIRTMIDNGT